MNFKKLQNCRVKLSLFDANYHKSLENDYHEQNSSIKQYEFDEISEICQMIDDYCDIENIFYLKDHISSLCQKFKEKYKFSEYCFNNSFISKSSLMYLIGLYSHESIPEQFRWDLVAFFVDASFHSHDFSVYFCSNSSALKCAKDAFADPKRHINNIKRFDILTKLMFNIVSDCPTFFETSYINELTIKAFQNKSTPLPSQIIDKYSFFLMNFFRFYTAQEAIEIFDQDNITMIKNLKLWFDVTGGYTFEHMMWCFYFWFINSSTFMPIFYETYFFNIIINHFQTNFDFNETCLRISLAVATISLFTDNDDYIQQIYESLPIYNIISMIFDENGLDNETKKLGLCLISNYAAHGVDFIDTLLENQFRPKILDYFYEFSSELKVECGFCFAIAILKGNEEQINYFTDEITIQILIDCLDIKINDLTLIIFKSFLKLIEIDTNVLNYIDPSVVDEIANDDQTNEEIYLISQNILSHF